MSYIERIRSSIEWSDGPSRDRKETHLGRALRNDFVQSLPFWLPPALLLGLFTYGFLSWNLLVSLTDWTGIAPPDYSLGGLGFENYARMLEDPGFWDAARNTVVLIVVFTVMTLVLGLVLAIVVDHIARGRGVFRTLFLMPFALSFVVTGIVWMWMFNPRSGFVNQLLRILQLDFLAQNWLGDPRFKLFAVIFALMWQFSGYAMVIMLAGLRRIPQAHIDAARVDGAGFFTTLRRVIIPQLGPAAVSAAVVLMTFTLGAFSWLYVVFGSNPGPSADILGVMMYREAFSANRWAYGAAIGMILFFVMCAIVAPYLYWQHTRGDL